MIKSYVHTAVVVFVVWVADVASEFMVGGYFASGTELVTAPVAATPVMLRSFTENGITENVVVEGEKAVAVVPIDKS